MQSFSCHGNRRGKKSWNLMGKMLPSFQYKSLCENKNSILHSCFLNQVQQLYNTILLGLQNTTKFTQMYTATDNMHTNELIWLFIILHLCERDGQTGRQWNIILKSLCPCSTLSASSVKYNDQQEPWLKQHDLNSAKSVITIPLLSRVYVSEGIGSWQVYNA